MALSLFFPLEYYMPTFFKNSGLTSFTQKPGLEGLVGKEDTNHCNSRKHKLREIYSKCKDHLAESACQLFKCLPGPTRSNWSEHLSKNAKEWTFSLGALGKRDRKAILNYAHAWVKTVAINRAAAIGPTVIEQKSEGRGWGARMEKAQFKILCTSIWSSTTGQLTSEPKQILTVKC